MPLSGAPAAAALAALAALPALAGSGDALSPHARAMARVRPSVVTLVATASAAELLDRLGRELGPAVRVRLEAAAAGAAQRRVATGIVWDANGHVVASASFAFHGGPFSLRLADGAERPAELVGMDLRSDVALFRTAPAGLVPASFAGAAGTPARGDRLCVVGATIESRCSHAEGALEGSALRPGAGRLHDYLALSAEASPGSAGAAVVNLEGEVVGMVTASRRGGGTMAIPAATVVKVASDLARDPELRRGWLGLNVVSVGGPGSAGAGLRLSGVVPGSPAERAGLMAGDLILSYRGRPIADVGSFVQMVGDTAPGDRAEIVWLRGGERHREVVEVSVRPAPERAGAVRVRIEDDRPWLGVSTEELTPALRRRLGLTAPGGVLVAEVAAGSPAEASGLLAGDVLLRFAGQEVTGVEQFSALVRAQAPRQRVSLDILRAGSPARLEATLGRRPAETVISQLPQFHLDFAPEEWQALRAAIDDLPPGPRRERFQDVRALLEQASPTEANLRRIEELRGEIERLVAAAPGR